MPELAAHLERAKELAEQIDLIEYGPEHRGFFETEEVTKLLAAALAACALAEARWWEPYIPDWFLTAAEQKLMVERLAALERAVGEKGKA